MIQPIKVISNNLKSIRLSRGLSLDQLSEMTDVSKSMLRQIETGNSSPTISTIWKIANGLRISFTSLLQDSDTDTEIRSFKYKEPIEADEAGYRLYPLITFDPQVPFESYYFEMDAHTTFNGGPHKGSVYEYVFITQGSLKMTLDSEEFTINEGEFIKFHADCPHSYINDSSEMVKGMMQVTYLQ
jgi:transcriptional regulator with XRE-family HTH domain